MRIKSLLFCLLCITLLESIQLKATPTSPSTFWITYVAGFHERHFIMKINLLGQVLVKPRRLLELDVDPFVGPIVPKATAISNRSPNTLNVWAYTNDFEIARAVIDKNTLEVQKIRFTNVKSSNPVHLQVTSRSDLNFLAFSQESVHTEYLRGQRITTTGLIESDSWQISDQSVGGGATCAFFRCGGAVSADGQMAVLMNAVPPKIKFSFSRSEIMDGRMATLCESVLLPMSEIRQSSRPM